MDTRQVYSYEDNLKALRAYTSLLDQILPLQLDHDQFGDKLVEDLFWISEGLHKIFLRLSEQSQLLGRVEHLRTLGKATDHLVRLLEKCLVADGPVYQHVARYEETLAQALEIHRSHMETIDQQVRSKEQLPDDIISEDELKSLMAPPLEDPED